ncbi:SRPBCC domain-containing protein [Nocardia sp. NPDC003726]
MGVAVLLENPRRNEIICEVLAAPPCKQLTYSWMYPQPEHRARCTVDWTLQPQGRGTRLLLTQTGSISKIVDRRWRATLRSAVGDNSSCRDSVR